MNTVIKHPQQMNPYTILRKDAAAYLTRRLGVSITTATLNQAGNRRDGPAFVLIANRALYSLESLEAWIALKMKIRGIKTTADEDKPCAE